MLTRTSLLSLALVGSALAQVQSPVIDLGYAQYQGAVNTTTNITSLIGIRYAAPPVGDLRFRAPQPPLNTSGIQSATVQPNECFQAPTGKAATNPLKRAAVVVPSEDCLFLNVFYPSNAVGTPGTKLPTLVWIHGGGYLAGSSNNVNGGDIIQQSNHNVVVVVIQYRLGAFGFLAGSAVKNGGALNAGLLDQDFALRWVQQHVSKFGGDPAKVTIWGESAGAGSVLQHVIANDGRTKPQLFRGAITSSTFLPSQYRYDDPISESLFSQVVAQTNCTPAADALSCLRATSAAVLQTANSNINAAGFFGTFTTVPVIDGEFIVEAPIDTLRKRRVNGKALLSVTNTFEGTVFVNTKIAVPNATTYALDLFPKVDLAEATTVASVYAGLGTDTFQVEAIMGESIFICPTYYLLEAFPKGHSFKGEFAIPPANHGNDLNYYFPSNNPPPFQNTDFINAFAQSFTSFIVNLDPNKKINTSTITPSWSSYSVGRTEMLFNKTAAGEPVVHTIVTDPALVARCSVWSGLGASTGQ
ncbi:unnamed protein product [Mycena citricolor]|uniref:Carboxylic ester hydrolase n=1 Tax=Mycena citricolor TaxID=2018698 RepID=A0AAD2H1V9_9AGAR|nr:unnamed protein product [Mycena citricolor]